MEKQPFENKMISPFSGMLIKYHVNNWCKSWIHPGWYFEPVPFLSDSININGNQVISVLLK